MNIFLFFSIRKLQKLAEIQFAFVCSRYTNAGLGSLEEVVLFSTCLKQTSGVFSRNNLRTVYKN